MGADGGKSSAKSVWCPIRGHRIFVYKNKCVCYINIVDQPKCRKEINMKKILSITAALLSVCLLLAACGQPAPTTKPATTAPNSTPAPTEQNPTVQTTQPTQATTVPTQPTEPPTQAPTEPTVPPTEPTVPPTQAPTEPTAPPTTVPPVIDPADLPEINIYLVGDSTVCSFSDKYYLPRYGYGTQLSNYLNEKVTIHNLALSGRSSKSFLAEANYQTLCTNLQPGDYLIIGFGHNDEKSDDSARFTDASKEYTDPNSFGYHLYEYYIKLALDAGATPILCTPIVRAATDNDYTGSEAHITANGDYRQAILDVAAAYNVPVVDLTAITKAQYEALGFDAAAMYHAIVAGQYADDGVTIVPNMLTVDKTHLNIYGAKYVAYQLASELNEIAGICYYVLDEIAAPTEADLIANPNYVVTDYTAPDLDNYSPADHYKVSTPGWYGTAFGDTGGNPQSAGNGYRAIEKDSGIFEVGQTAGSNKGKFSSSTDGFAFLFTQVQANQNFIITVNATILNAPSAVNQAGFGLMLRDDVYINEEASNSSINGNYVTAGILGGKDSCTALFYRENTTLAKGENFANAAFAAGDQFTFTIERVGQSVTCTITFGDTTYTTTHYDFDFFANDTEYMYIGMFANRGTVVEFTNLQFTITGESQGA